MVIDLRIGSLILLKSCVDRYLCYSCGMLVAIWNMEK